MHRPDADHDMRNGDEHLPDTDQRQRAQSLAGWADTYAAGQRLTGAPAGTTALRNRRILVVDHYVDGAESLAAVLRYTGRDVVTAYDAATALQLAESFRPHAIIVGLRRLDRHAACRALRSTPWGKAAVILAMSARGGEDDRRAAFDAGFDGFFQKPPLLPALLERLDDSAPAPD